MWKPGCKKPRERDKNEIISQTNKYHSTTLKRETVKRKRRNDRTSIKIQINILYRASVVWSYVIIFDHQIRKNTCLNLAIPPFY